MIAYLSLGGCAIGREGRDEGDTPSFAFEHEHSAPITQCPRVMNWSPQRQRRFTRAFRPTMADLTGGRVGDAMDAIEGFGALFTGEADEAEDDFEGVDQVVAISF